MKSLITKNMLIVWGDLTLHLVVVVIQVWVSALQLHHLDLGDPFLLLLSHQVTVGVSAAPVPSGPAAVPAHRGLTQCRNFKVLLLAHTHRHTLTLLGSACAE